MNFIKVSSGKKCILPNTDMVATACDSFSRHVLTGYSSPATSSSR